MTDQRKMDEDKAKSRLPFAMAAVIALFAYFTAGGLWAVILVGLAFAVGYLPVEKTFFFINGIEENRRNGREALHKLTDDQIDEILAIVRTGRKIEAIKVMRAMHNDGLKDAKDAIDLLDDFGLKWRDSQDKPPA